MHEFRSLKMIDLFAPLFRRLHIDYPLMRHILAVKLLMDGRRVPTIFNDGKKKKGNQFIKSLGLYALYGLILIVFVFGDVYMYQMSIAFGIALFILMTAFIADFSVVLLDIRDKTIIGTKPIDRRTMAAAKFVHVAIYMTLLTGAFLLIPVMVMIFVQGIGFALLFVALMVLFVLFIIALTSLIYIFVLQVFSGEQLKNMINYIQIILSVGIVIGYQIVIRSFDIVHVDIVYAFKWWHAFLPPMWFAAPFELVLHGDTNGTIIFLSCFALFVPLVSIFVYYQLMPAFEANLQKLIETVGNAKEKRMLMRTMWEKLLCKTRTDRAYFRFAYTMVRAEREFKLKVYPTLGMGLVFPFIFIFSEFGHRTLADIAQGRLYFYIYFMQIIIGVVVHTLQFSGSYKGAWIFPAAGIIDTSGLYRSAIKVFLVTFYLPVFALVGAAFYVLFDQFHLIDLAIVFAGAMIQTILSYQITIKEKYPFSAPFDRLKEGGYTAIAFILMFLTLPFVLLHFLSTLLPYGVYAYFVLLVGASVGLWRIILKK